MPIDTAVYLSWRRCAWITAYCVAMVGIMVLIGVMWQAYVVAVFVILWMAYQEYHAPILTYLVSAGADELWQWQIVLDRTQPQASTQLWQGYVNAIDDKGICVVLKCYVVEPIKCHKNFVIFGDMMDDESYRRLKALARFYPARL